jgi:hypothetical protein
MGGVHVHEALRDPQRARRSAICRPPTRPTAIRRGSAARRRRSKRIPGFAAKRCAGLDILAYRATEPADRVAACRRRFLDSGVVVVAGSVNSPERRRGRSRPGADAFTIGAAVIDASYAPGAGPFVAQLGAVLADCRAAGDGFREPLTQPIFTTRSNCVIDSVVWNDGRYAVQVSVGGEVGDGATLDPNFDGGTMRRGAGFSARVDDRVCRPGAGEDALSP